MSLLDKISREKTPVQSLHESDFVPGFTPELFPDMPQLETRSPQRMALDIEILRGDIENLTARLLALENK